MASVTKTYLVVSPLPVVIESGGAAISYQPGAVFTSKNTNPSVVRLLGLMQIIESDPNGQTQGYAVIQGEVGPQGPQGDVGPIGPAGGLPSALAIDNTTGGLDIEITDLDNIIGQSDGGWVLGSADGGTTPLRPDIIFVKTSIVVGGTVTVTAGAITGSAALLVISGLDSDLLLTAEDATPTSSNDGGTVIITAGAKDGAGADGKVEFRGNYANPLVMDIDGGVTGFWDASVKTIQVLGNPGAIRVGRNTQLTAAEGDFVFGNDGTLTGTPTGLLLWDASTAELAVRNSSNLRMIDIDGGSNEVAVYEATGIRGLKMTTNGGVAEFRAEDATFRSGVDTVLPTLIRGGNADGTENGGLLTLAGGRALGSGSDAGIQFRTGNLERWSIDLNGSILAGADNGYNIGAVGASRPLHVYVGTDVVLGATTTLGESAWTISGPLTVTGAASAGAGAAWAWTPQAGGAGVAGVSPTVAFTGGDWAVTGGAGGAAEGTAVGGETGGDAAIGGALLFTGGPGGAGQAGAVDPGQPAAGGPLWLFGGPGGPGAGTSDNANGSNVLIRGGIAGTGGSGAAALDGDVVIGDTATKNVTVGSGSVSLTSLVGSITTIDGGVSIGFETGGGAKWTIPTAGHFFAAADDTHDIGAVGANRPQSIFIGTSAVIASTVTVSATSIASTGLLTISSTGALSLDSTTGAIQTDATSIIADAGLSILTAAAGVLTLDSDTTGAVNLGTVGVKTITIGNVTGATALAYNAGTGGHTFIGNIGFFSTPPVAQQADTVALTDSSTGTPDNTVAAVSGTPDDATINDNFAELTAKYNALRTLLQTYGIMA